VVSTAPAGASRAQWRGVLADVSVVTVTPFGGRGLEAVDHAGLEANLEHILGAGARLLVAGGNTGEFAALRPDEVVDVVRTHVRAAAGRARVVAGIGYRLDEAIALGRAATEAGADALMVHQPSQPYAGEAGLVAYYRAIAAGLDTAPLILYLRGPQLTRDGVRALAEVPSIVGLKVGVPDPEHFASLVQAAPGLAWVCGVAEGWAVPFRRAGAIGFTSGVANVAPDRSLAIRDAIATDDLDRAEALVERLRPFERLRARHADANNVAVVKAALDAIGLTGGGLRPPLSALDAGDRDELMDILREMEVLP
jgi:4-hydroxy-tetrahydrodipicolinate synthase